MTPDEHRSLALIFALILVGALVKFAVEVVMAVIKHSKEERDAKHNDVQR
jgi:hypothetical protein